MFFVQKNRTADALSTLVTFEDEAINSGPDLMAFISKIEILMSFPVSSPDISLAKQIADAVGSRQDDEQFVLQQVESFIEPGLAEVMVRV